MAIPIENQDFTASSRRTSSAFAAMCCEELRLPLCFPSEQFRLGLFPHVLNAGRVKVHGHLSLESAQPFSKLWLNNHSGLGSPLLLIAGEVQVSAMTPVVTSRSFRSACSSSCCP